MTTPLPTRRALTFIFVTVLVDAIGFGIIIPVLPELIMELSGEGVSAAARYGGWLAFVFAVMQFLCAPILGALSDRFGRRLVLLFSLFSFGVDYLIMGFAPTLAWLFVGRTLAGMAGASFSPANAYIADVTPKEKRAQSFGLVGAALGMGFIIGPALGGLLGALGPRAPFFAAAGAAFANFSFGLFVLPESLPAERRRPFTWARANPAGTLAQIRKVPSVYGLMGALFLWQLGHQALPSTWSFYTIYKFGWSEAAIGASLAFVGVIVAISQGVLTRVLIPRLGGERRAATAGLMAGSLVYIGYAFATRGWMMYVCMLPWFLAGMTYPSINGLMSRQVDADSQGELQGAIASVYGLASIVGPPLMTQLFGRLSGPGAPIEFPGAAFLCAGLLAAAALVLFLRAAPEEKTTSAAIG
jgi:DHA1 family tetracycline resistance protein-like MFS transporter